MSGWVGRELRIAIAGQVLAAVKAKSVSYATAAIDITEGERDGNRRLADVGDVRTVDIFVEGVCTAANWPALHALWLSDELAPVSVLHPNGAVTAGDAFLSSLARTGESTGYVSFQATLQMIGEAEQGLYFTSEVYPSDAVLPTVPLDIHTSEFTAGSAGVLRGYIQGSLGSLGSNGSDVVTLQSAFTAISNGNLQITLIAGSQPVSLAPTVVGAAFVIQGYGVFALSSSVEGEQADRVLQPNEGVYWTWETIPAQLANGSTYVIQLSATPPIITSVSQASPGADVDIEWLAGNLGPFGYQELEGYRIEVTVNGGTTFVRGTVGPEQLTFTDTADYDDGDILEYAVRMVGEDNTFDSVPFELEYEE